MSLRARVAGLAAAALLTTGLAAAPATAADGSAPVTVADKVTLAESDYAELDLLANDSDPDGDELAICRFGDVPDGIGIETMSSTSGDEDQSMVLVGGRRPGTYTVTYYACDFDHLTPGTLTVTVTKAPKVKVKVTKTAKPGRLKVVNDSGFPVRFMWGSINEGKPDGSRMVRGKAVLIKVQRRSIVWVAAGRGASSYDAGVVRGITLPKGTKPLPPGAPAGGNVPTADVVIERAAASWR